MELIDRLRGVVVHTTAQTMVVEAAGIGYEVNVLADREQLGTGEVILYIHEVVREGQRTWYGFTTRERRNGFRQLLNVPGIGPRIAMLILAKSSLQQIGQAVQAEDTAFFARLPGIGRKTAQRIVVCDTLARKLLQRVA